MPRLYCPSPRSFVRVVMERTMVSLSGALSQERGRDAELRTAVDIVVSPSDVKLFTKPREKFLKVLSVVASSRPDVTRQLDGAEDRCFVTDIDAETPKKTFSVWAASGVKTVNVSLWFKAEDS
ncbi:hypothetical protein BaRGS_00036395 [Batillaria attramentaria]|uniref:Uncharacterized protein n=1 Tax=Batillaria attramentaria TaxID=370345 RepID=A0ABD0JC75_9CAEN